MIWEIFLLTFIVVISGTIGAIIVLYYKQLEKEGKK